MARTRFDSVCKNLVMELADGLGFQPIAQFNIHPQKRVEQLLGFVGAKSKRKESVDVVWNYKLPKYGTFLANEVFADVAVAWEVDISSNPHKSIRSSIENLDTLNPRLGVELLLIGATLKSINGFDKNFDYAVDIASRSKKSRIVVIHDVIFAILHDSITGRHPEELYRVYIDACKNDKQVANAFKKKVEDLLRTSKIENLDFKKELQAKLLDQL